MKKILIAGAGPSQHGVGRVIATLLPIAKKNGFHALYPFERKPLGHYLKGKKILQLVKDVSRKIISRIIFSIRVRFITGYQVLLIHPQSVGWGNVVRLCRRNTVNFYIMDNSFFCIRSYNHKENTFHECFDCIDDLSNCSPDCTPFPVKYDKLDNLQYLSSFKGLASQITFLVQCRSQAQLLERYFGKIKWRLVGLVTYEFVEAVIRPDTDQLPAAHHEIDIVYHGVTNEAKGIRYVLQLAQYLPEFTFLIPDDKDAVLALVKDTAIPSNVVCERMSWETGLREYVTACKLVMCPSLWSAPIEGALIKSFLYNGCVAVFNTQYGFHAELPDDLVLRLSIDFQESARSVRNYLLSCTQSNARLSNRQRISDLVNAFEIDAVFKKE